MIRAVLASILLATATIATAAAQPAEPRVASVVGAGADACRAWLLEDDAHHIETTNWVLGYWSSLNATQPAEATATAAAAEVHAVCRLEPNLPLWRAVERAHTSVLERRQPAAR